MDKFEIVQTECGSVKGVHKLSALDDDYVSFQGIPYMKAPVGKLRFREAQPVEKWNDIFDATGDAPSFCSLNFITFECEQCSEIYRSNHLLLLKKSQKNNYIK